MCSTSEGIPYIGSNSRTMKDMIDKFQTHRTLAARGVPVPATTSCGLDDRLSASPTPPSSSPWASRARSGINDDSVVNDAEELRRQVAWIRQEFQQAALVEDFMPGDEFTVLVLGNGDDPGACPGWSRVEPSTTASTRCCARICGASASRRSACRRPGRRRPRAGRRPPMPCTAWTTCAST